MVSSYSMDVRLNLPMDKAVDEVTAALAAEGFGVLTKIDVEQAFRDKIGKEFRPYVILGACNPELAYRALSHKADVGLMLPCNVTVEAGPTGDTLVQIVRPEVMLQVGELAGDDILGEVAGEAAERLGRVARSLESIGSK